MDKKLKALLDKKLELLASCNTLLEGTTDDVLSADEAKQFDEYQVQLNAVVKSIESVEKMAALERAEPAAATAHGAPASNAANPPSIVPGTTTPNEPAAFDNISEQLVAIMQAGSPGGVVDPR